MKKKIKHTREPESGCLKDSGVKDGACTLHTDADSVYSLQAGSDQPPAGIEQTLMGK